MSERERGPADVETGERIAALAGATEEAGKVYAENAAGHVLGRPAPYAERLQFVVPRGGTEDPDESNIGGAMARQTAGKIKDMVTGTEGGPPSG